AAAVPAGAPADPSAVAAAGTQFDGGGREVLCGAVETAIGLRIRQGGPMARSADPQIEHLLRRAGFGARPDELDYYGSVSVSEAVDLLVEYDGVADDVDDKIGKAGY